MAHVELHARVKMDGLTVSGVVNGEPWTGDRILAQVAAIAPGLTPDFGDFPLPEEAKIAMRDFVVQAMTAQIAMLAQCRGTCAIDLDVEIPDGPDEPAPEAPDPDPGGVAVEAPAGRVPVPA